VHCIKCGREYTRREVHERLEHEMPPRCDACQCVLKPSVVLFGEALPSDELSRAFDVAGRCKVMLAVGSSLLVYPAANIPRIARQAGATLVIVSPEPTAQDDLADHVLRANAGEVLPRIVEEVRNIRIPEHLA
jgi:NAD-dependent deacetylase